MATRSTLLFCAGLLLAARPALAGGRLISAADLAAKLTDKDLVVLFVSGDRDQGAFDKAHIPGARVIRYADIAVEGADDVGSELPAAADLERVFEEAGVSDSSQVVIYGNTVMAARVFFTLDAAGHQRVALLDGGFRAWEAEKRPVETGPATSAGRKGTFTPKIDPSRVATAAFIQQQKAGIALVDVRPDEEFTGKDGGMGGMHAAGHIDGATQMPWNTLVGADGRFLPAGELRAKLTAAGAAPGKPVVSYCMVGMRASVVYFVARHLGFDARLYDGSIVDWGNRKLPTKPGR